MRSLKSCKQGVTESWQSNGTLTEKSEGWWKNGATEEALVEAGAAETGEVRRRIDDL